MPFLPHLLLDSAMAFLASLLLRFSPPELSHLDLYTVPEHSSVFWPQGLYTGPCQNVLLSNTTEACPCLHIVADISNI